MIHSREIYLVIAFICGLNAYAFSQNSATTPANPDLSGTWEIAQKKGSDLRSRRMVVTQSNDQIVLEERLEYEKEVVTNRFTLFPDGRGESYVMVTRYPDVQFNVTSKTFWKNGKLTRRLSYDAPMEIGGRRTSSQQTDTETYSLSKDGTELTVKVVSSKVVQFSTTPMFYSGQRTYKKQT